MKIKTCSSRLAHLHTAKWRCSKIHTVYTLAECFISTVEGSGGAKDEGKKKKKEKKKIKVFACVIIAVVLTHLRSAVLRSDECRVGETSEAVRKGLSEMRVKVGLGCIINTERLAMHVVMW